MTSPLNSCCLVVRTIPQDAAQLDVRSLPEALASTSLTFGGLAYPTDAAQIYGVDWIPIAGPNVGDPPTVNGYVFSTIPGANGNADLNVVTVDYDTTASLAGDVWAFVIQTTTEGDIMLARIDLVP